MQEYINATVKEGAPGAEKPGELATLLSTVLAEAGFPVQVPAVGPLVGLFFADSPVTNYDEARRSCASGLYSPSLRRLERRARTHSA